MNSASASLWRRWTRLSPRFPAISRYCAAPAWWLTGGMPSWVFYRVNPTLAPEHARLLAAAIAAARGTAEHEADQARLAAFAGRPRRASAA